MIQVSFSQRYLSEHLSMSWGISAIDKYRAGYTDCAREVARYLATPEPPPLANAPTLSEPGSKARLLRHLDQCIAEIDIEICPTTTASFADSPSSSCYDINTASKKR